VNIRRNIWSEDKKYKKEKKTHQLQFFFVYWSKVPISLAFWFFLSFFLFVELKETNDHYLYLLLWHKFFGCIKILASVNPVLDNVNFCFFWDYQFKRKFFSEDKDFPSTCVVPYWLMDEKTIFTLKKKRITGKYPKG
jgi:hypothetical protein